VHNIGAIEGNQAVLDNDWETVTRGGDAAIQRWIDGQLRGTSCALVLIGAETAGRKWIDYEINKAWTLGKGVLGIHIHKLLDRDGRPSTKGGNPFTSNSLGLIGDVHDPSGYDSKQVYETISSNFGRWVEQAVSIRTRYPGATTAANG